MTTQEVMVPVISPTDEEEIIIIVKKLILLLFSFAVQSSLVG